MKPVRYTSTHVRLNLWQSLMWLLRRGEWTRYRAQFTPVHEGEPGYEDAPYGMAVIWREAPPEVLQEHEHKP